MIKSIRNIGLLLAGVILFNSCKTSFDDVKPATGTADFTSYVALGNSLTAGYSDGALCYEGQKNAYPSILAQQFRTVGGASVFETPFLTGSNVDNGVSPAPSLGLFATTPKYILKYVTDCKGASSLAPGLIAPPTDPNSEFYTPIFNGTYYQNMGVPGAKSFDLLRHDLGVLGNTVNPFYLRFASDINPGGTSTVVSDALYSNPTFFTLWIGSNDVLGYATSGGSGIVGGVNPNDITTEALFDSSIVNIVRAMTANGAKGVIGNIPDVTNIPYFTTVPAKGLELTDANDVAALNTAYTVYNTAAQAAGLPAISFQLGANPFVVQDLSAQYAPVGGMRQVKNGEYIILTIPQDSIKCAGWGSQKAIPVNYVLDANEVSNVKNYTTKYNNYIKKTATDFDLAFADFNSFFKTFQTGILFNGVTYTPEFVKGGAFGLDGVHPNQRGYALIANYYIDVINSKYSSSIAKVDVNAYKGLQFP
ncbi:MAG: SGNH/GDSL hydrolase family protein [Bacteroidia bacterium]